MHSFGHVNATIISVHKFHSLYHIFPIDFDGCARLHHSEIPSEMEVALCCKLRTLLTLLKLLTLFTLLTLILLLTLLTLLSLHTTYTFLEQNGYFG